MSPQELERWLQRRGMTIDDAIRKAEEMGISVDQYLLQLSMAGQADVQKFQPQPLESAVPDSALLQRAAAQPLEPLFVPGFHDRVGIDSLIQPFGFDIFRYPPTAFAPSVFVATPPSYALGPGDEVLVSVWGETRLNYQLTVNRDGDVVVPDIGPVSARGQTIDQFRTKLLRRMSSIYSGLMDGDAGANSFLDVSLGKLKTIQVLVMGEVLRPGGYPMPSMSTVLHAVYAAGGPRVDGTLREVRIVRGGKAVRTVDLYSFILRGEQGGSFQLQDGDVVHVRPVGRRVAVVGEIMRPAIYELKKGESLGDLVSMAGGLRFNTYFERVHVQRFVPFDQRGIYEEDVLDFDLWFNQVGDLLNSRRDLENGDIVTFFRVTDYPVNRVTIAGSVKKPGPFELIPEMRIGDLVMAADSLRRATFAERGTLFRMLPDLRRQVYGFNPRLALEGDLLHNLLLKNEDSVVVYADTQFVPRRTVSINGAIRQGGVYTRHESMTLADVVVLAGGLVDGASTSNWEVARLDTSEMGVYRRILKVTAGEEYWTDADGQALLLEDFDAVFIPFNPKFSHGQSVRVTGYVMYPGTYTLRHEEERLVDIVARAGGLRDGAYLEGSRLFREYSDAGLVPLDFASALTDSTSLDNIVLYDGDSIYVSRTEEVVYVSGEVYV
ncbi:MAG: SLBB domain-containing protein, partial [Bacteroidota bacterium]